MTEEKDTNQLLEQDKAFVERDFVHCGFRFSSDGQLFVAVCPLAEDGSLMPEAHYAYNKKRDRIIGYIYSGARFSEDSVKGLDTAVSKERYKDDAQRMTWRAISDDALVQEKKLKMLKDEKKMNEFESVLLPLRKVYTSARKRNDFSAMAALEHAVIRALTTPIRKSEE